MSKIILAEKIAIVQEDGVVMLQDVPWLNEELADIGVICRRSDGKRRIYALKVLGTLSPWAGFLAVEKYVAAFSDVEEVGMLHDIITGYGRY